MNEIEKNLLVVSFAMLFTALFVALAGLTGIIKKSPDESPYNVLMPLLTFGGGILGAGTALFSLWN